MKIYMAHIRTDQIIPVLNPPSLLFDVAPECGINYTWYVTIVVYVTSCRNLVLWYDHNGSSQFAILKNYLSYKDTFNVNPNKQDTCKWLISNLI